MDLAVNKILWYMVMFYAIVTSCPVVEHNNGRFSTIGFRRYRPCWLPMMMDNVGYRPFLRVFWNFVELLMGLVKQNNYCNLIIIRELHMRCC